VALPSIRSTASFCAENADRTLPSPGFRQNRFGAGRCDSLDPARTGAATDTVDEIGCRPEFALHDRPPDEGVVHHQHPDRRGVARYARAVCLLLEYV